MKKFILILPVLSLFFASFGSTQERQEGSIAKVKLDSSFYEYAFFGVMPFDGTREFSCGTPYGEESIRFVTIGKSIEGYRNIRIQGRKWGGWGDFYSETKVGSCSWDEAMVWYSCLEGQITFAIPPSSELELGARDNGATSAPSLGYYFTGSYRKTFGYMKLDCSQEAHYASFKRL